MVAIGVGIKAASFEKSHSSLELTYGRVSLSTDVILNQFQQCSSTLMTRWLKLIKVNQILHSFLNPVLSSFRVGLCTRCQTLIKYFIFL